MYSNSIKLDKPCDYCKESEYKHDNSGFYCCSNCGLVSNIRIQMEQEIGEIKNMMKVKSKKMKNNDSSSDEEVGRDDPGETDVSFINKSGTTSWCGSNTYIKEGSTISSLSWPWSRISVNKTLTEEMQDNQKIFLKILKGVIEYINKEKYFKNKKYNNSTTTKNNYNINKNVKSFKNENNNYNYLENISLESYDNEDKINQLYPLAKTMWASILAKEYEFKTKGKRNNINNSSFLSNLKFERSRENSFDLKEGSDNSSESENSVNSKNLKGNSDIKKNKKKSNANIKKEDKIINKYKKKHMNIIKEHTKRGIRQNNVKNVYRVEYDSLIKDSKKVNLVELKKKFINEYDAVMKYLKSLDIDGEEIDTKQLIKNNMINYHQLLKVYTDYSGNKINEKISFEDLIHRIYMDNSLTLPSISSPPSFSKRTSFISSTYILILLHRILNIINYTPFTGEILNFYREKIILNKIGIDDVFLCSCDNLEKFGKILKMWECERGEEGLYRKIKEFSGRICKILEGNWNENNFETNEEMNECFNKNTDLNDNDNNEKCVNHEDNSRNKRKNKTNKKVKTISEKDNENKININNKRNILKFTLFLITLFRGKVKERIKGYIKDGYNCEIIAIAIVFYAIKIIYGMNNNLPYFIIFYINYIKGYIKIEDNKLEKNIIENICNMYKKLKSLSKDPINDFYLSIPTQFEVIENMLKYIEKKGESRIITNTKNINSNQKKFEYINICADNLYSNNLNNEIIRIVNKLISEMKAKLLEIKNENMEIEDNNGISNIDYFNNDNDNDNAVINYNNEDNKEYHIIKISPIKSQAKKFSKKWIIKKSTKVQNYFKNKKNYIKYNQFFNEEIDYYKINIQNINNNKGKNIEKSVNNNEDNENFDTNSENSSIKNIELPLPCDTVLRIRKKGFKLLNNNNKNNISEEIFSYFFCQCFDIKYNKLKIALKIIENEFKYIYN